MNATLSLPPEMAADLSECEVGSEEQLNLTVKVTKNDATGFEAEVSAVDYEAVEDTADELNNEGDVPSPDKSSVKKGPAGNPALMIVLGGKHPGK